MARFDVYHYAGTGVPFVVDVQANLLSDLSSRVVVPLVPAGKATGADLQRLNPEIEITGQVHIMMTTDIGVISTAQLGVWVGNIEQVYRDDITAALDFLFQGF